MLYDYGCHNCGEILEDIKQSIHEEALTQCPSCGKNSLERVLYGGLGAFVKDVKTIGQLADKNWSKMGFYEKSEVCNKPSNSNYNKEKVEQRKKINKMSEAQKQKYIITGES